VRVERAATRSAGGDSAAIVPNTSELLPEPETPVKTISRRFGSSMLTSLRCVHARAMHADQAWLSAACMARGSTLSEPPS